MHILDELKFDSNGLIPAIIQDFENNDVLMMGYMNREAVQRTLQSGRVTFWSRSRRNTGLRGRLRVTRRRCGLSPLIVMRIRY